jgi:hypothetical protein
MLSSIKSIKNNSPFANEVWSEKDLRLLSLTNGNVGFREFMLSYNIDFNGLTKYKSRAAIFYLADVITYITHNFK